jgi:hypothetical protein
LAISNSLPVEKHCEETEIHNNTMRKKEKLCPAIIFIDQFVEKFEPLKTRII